MTAPEQWVMKELNMVSLSVAATEQLRQKDDHSVLMGERILCGRNHSPARNNITVDDCQRILSDIADAEAAVSAAKYRAMTERLGSLPQGSSSAIW